MIKIIEFLLDDRGSEVVEAVVVTAVVIIGAGAIFITLRDQVVAFLQKVLANQFM